jgi:plastocyanin
VARLPSRDTVLLSTALTALTLLACGEGSGVIGVITTDTTGSGTGQLLATVQVTSNAFTPSLVNLRSGGIVTWVWADTTSQHNVTFNDPLRSSQTQSSGLHSVVFQSVGTFNYVCTVHTGMTGSIVVR